MMSHIRLTISIATVASGFVEDYYQPVKLKPHTGQSVVYILLPTLEPRPYVFPPQREVEMDIVTGCTTSSFYSYCEV